MTPKIAIIGGGVSGASSLIQLVKEAKSSALKLDITIFNPSPEFATGLPYRSDLPNRFLLNHESTDMGGIKVDQNVGHDDFYHWVQKNLETLKPRYPDFDLASKNEYVPRNLYGQYMRERYEEAKSYARANGISIHEVQASVSDVVPLRQKTQVYYSPAVHSAAPMSDHYDKVIIALGHAYAPGASQIEASGQYFKPNQVQKLLERGDVKNKRVIIQGSGQYADEIALALLDAGAANVKMISRHGWLHAVRGRYEPYERRFLTIDNLEARSGKDKPFRLADVIDLLKQEMERAIGKPIDWGAVWAPVNTPEKLAQDIAVAESGAELKWRSVLLSLKGIRQQIFERLDPADKEEFTHQYRALFFAYQAPIPVKIAKKLLAGMQEGRLEVLGGWQTSEWLPEKKTFRISRVKHNGGGHDPTQAAKDENFESLEADYLISANGQTLNPEHIPLLKTMIEHGAIERAQSGGVRINIKNQHIVGNNGESENIYALGPITNGERLISSNAHFCMESAHIIARSIVSELSRGHAATSSLAQPTPGKSRL